MQTFMYKGFLCVINEVKCEYGEFGNITQKFIPIRCWVNESDDPEAFLKNKVDEWFLQERLFDADRHR